MGLQCYILKKKKIPICNVSKQTLCRLCAISHYYRTTVVSFMMPMQKENQRKNKLFHRPISMMVIRMCFIFLKPLKSRMMVKWEKKNRITLRKSITKKSLFLSMLCASLSLCNQPFFLQYFLIVCTISTKNTSVISFPLHKKKRLKVDGKYVATSHRTMWRKIYLCGWKEKKIVCFSCCSDGATTT